MSSVSPDLISIASLSLLLTFFCIFPYELLILCILTHVAYQQHHYLSISVFIVVVAGSGSGRVL